MIFSANVIKYIWHIFYRFRYQKGQKGPISNMINNLVLSPICMLYPLNSSEKILSKMAKIVNLFFKFILILFSQFLLVPFKQILLPTDDFSLIIITFNRFGVGGSPCRLAVVVLFYTQCNNSIQRMLSKFM